MKKLAVIGIVLLILFIGLYAVTGFFVIQPIGSIPEGRTIWFFRTGLNIPFISSADGLLLKSEAGVSLFGRAMMIASVYSIIKDRTIAKLPYIRMLYLMSTHGVEFEK